MENIKIKHLPYIEFNKQKKLFIPKDAQYFFKEDYSKINKYIKDNFWIGDQITEYGYDQLYVNDWVKENTEFKRLTYDEYINTKYQYILVDKQTLYNLVFEWPAFFKISDDDCCSCIFSNKTGIDVYNEIIEQENYVCIKIVNIPWCNGKEYKVFNIIPSKLMLIRLQKKNRIYWERVSNLTKITFKEII